MERMKSEQIKTPNHTTLDQTIKIVKNNNNNNVILKSFR